MKIKKSIDVEQGIIDTLNEKYPDIPFTKLVERGLKLLLNPDIINEKVTLDDDTMVKMDRLFKRVYDLHNHVLK
jgi:hypothetical protein